MISIKSSSVVSEFKNNIASFSSGSVLTTTSNSLIKKVWQVEEITNEYLEERDQSKETVQRQLESERKIKPVKCRKHCYLKIVQKMCSSSLFHVKIKKKGDSNGIGLTIPENDLVELSRLMIIL
jgi:hypothetical protein